jgi:site-specific recombinase XerD
MMTLRERIVEEIARTVGPGEAAEANICLGLLIRYFADRSQGFLEATSEQLSEFLRARGNADTTIARRLSTCRRIFAVLLTWGLIDGNAAMQVRRPAIRDKITDFAVSPGAVDRLIEMQQDFVTRVHAALLRTESLILALIHLVAGGSFLSEVGGLSAGDLCDDRIIVGRDTPDERAIWLSFEAISAIGAAVRASGRSPLSPHSPLLVTRGGHIVDTKMAWRLVNRAIGRAGLTGTLTPAKIHRAAVKSVLNHGLGWRAACQPCGYRQIPRVYSRPSIAELEQAIARNHPFETV